MEPARNETQDRIKRWLPTEAEVVRVAVSRPQEKRPGYGYWWPHPRPRFKHTRKRLLPSMAADAEYQVPSIIRQWTAEGVQRTENGLAPRRVRVWYECHTDSMVELARTRRERLVQHLAFHTANAGAWLFGEPHQRGRDTMYQVRLLDYRPRERVWLLNTSRYRQGNATYLAGKDEISRIIQYKDLKPDNLYIRCYRVNQFSTQGAIKTRRPCSNHKYGA